MRTSGDRKVNRLGFPKGLALFVCVMGVGILLGFGMPSLAHFVNTL